MKPRGEYSCNVIMWGRLQQFSQELYRRTGRTEPDSISGPEGWCWAEGQTNILLSPAVWPFSCSLLNPRLVTTLEYLWCSVIADEKEKKHWLYSKLTRCIYSTFKWPISINTFCLAARVMDLDFYNTFLGNPKVFTLESLFIHTKHTHTHTHRWWWSVATAGLRQIDGCQSAANGPPDHHRTFTHTHMRQCG